MHVNGDGFFMSGEDMSRLVRTLAQDCLATTVQDESFVVKARTVYAFAEMIWRPKPNRNKMSFDRQLREIMAEALTKFIHDHDSIPDDFRDIHSVIQCLRGQ